MMSNLEAGHMIWRHMRTRLSLSLRLGSRKIGKLAGSGKFAISAGYVLV